MSIYPKRFINKAYVAEYLESRICLNGQMFPGEGPTVGKGPVSVIAADFNDDGKPDLATANSEDNTVSISLGDGEGGFAAARSTSVGSSPSSVASADLNGDGRVDLAVANAESNDVSILAGNGDGTFNLYATIGVGTNPQSLIAADFNRDGTADLAVANSDSNSVSVIFCGGFPLFAGSINAVGSLPSSLTSADFNNDGKVDLAVANRNSNNISILIGNGNGTFAAGPTLGVALNPESVVAGDFNQDGNADLATANAGSNSVSVILGNGGEGFANGAGFAVDISPSKLVVADFDNDGRNDLAIVGLDPEQLAGARADDDKDMAVLALGNGAGSFDVRASRRLGGDLRSITSADLNGDGLSDISVANFNGNAVSVLLGNRSGVFGIGDLLPSFGGQFLKADFNEDGKLDLAFGAGAGLPGVLIGNGDGTFSAAPPSPTGGNGYSAWDAIADVNNDGHVDIVGSGWVMLGHGDGTFIRVGASNIPGGGGMLISGDFNGDGSADVAKANYYGGNSVTVKLGRGDGTFNNLPFIRVTVGPDPYGLATADFNHDGRADFVASCSDGTISVCLGSASGAFAIAPFLAMDAGEGNVVVCCDFDGDGNIDVTSSNILGNTISVFWGHGDGTFSGANKLEVGEGSWWIDSGDFNGDRKLDIAVWCAAGNKIAILLGDGSRQFAGYTNILVPSYEEGDGYFISGDFNNDNMSDLITETIAAGTAVIVSNADSTDQIAEAISFGAMTKSRFLSLSSSNRAPQTRSIDDLDDVDMYSVTVSAGQRVGFDVDVLSGTLDSYLRLFNSAGVQLAANDNTPGPGELTVGAESYLEYSFAAAGTYYVGVSKAGNNAYDAVTGRGDVDSGAVPANGYVLIASPGITGTVKHDFGILYGGEKTFIVDILAAGANPPPIDLRAETERWLVIHGRVSSRDSQAPANIKSLIDAVAANRSSAQVLSLDWSGPAYAPGSELRQEDWIETVAAWAALAINQFGIETSKQLNLIGHSWGANVAAEIGERVFGGVNTIVALDPAQNGPIALGGGIYNPDTSVNFSNVSQFSWAFFSRDSVGDDSIATYFTTLGNPVTAATADESIVVRGSGHSYIVNLFSWMLKNPSIGASPSFKLDRLLAYQAGPWALNTLGHDGLSPRSSVFYGGTSEVPKFEAVLWAGPNGQSAPTLPQFPGNLIGNVKQLPILGDPIPPRPFGPFPDPRGGGGLAM